MNAPMMKTISLFAIGYERADRILKHLERIFEVDDFVRARQESSDSIGPFKEIGERAAKVNEKMATTDWRKRFCTIHDYETIVFSDSNHTWLDQKAIFCKNCGLIF